MKIVNLLSLFLFATVTLSNGCADSGISDSSKIAALSLSERIELCDEIDQFRRSVTCAGDSDPKVWEINPSECIDELSLPTNCAITAGLLRECVKQIGAQTDAEFCQSNAPACEELEETPNCKK
jgi:hypothetical protein